MSRNPYHVPDRPPELRKSVFVFMDILGYSEMIAQAEKMGTQQQFLHELHSTLSKGRAELEDRDSQPALLPKDNFALKAFTDNIVIGWPIHDDAESEFGVAFFKLALFQFQMVLEGFFIRGALTVGDAYVDEIAVFGPALTQTYTGESVLSRDPRIILMRPAVNTAKRHLKYYGDPRRAPHVRAILRDTDHQWFLNYLDCVLMAEEEQGPFYEEFERHKAIVEKKLVEYQDRPAIWAKYAWVAGYHNFFCDLHHYHFSDDNKINVELFRASPALIVD